MAAKPNDAMTHNPVDREEMTEEAPDVSDFRYSLLVWQKLRSGERLTISDIAEASQLKPDQLYRAIDRVEQGLKRKLVIRVRGQHARLANASDGAWAEIHKLCSQYDALMGSDSAKSQIRLGTGGTFAISALPKILRAFDAQYPDISVDVTIDYPEDLRTREQQGMLDLFVASYPEYLPIGENVSEYRLPLALITHFESELAATFYQYRSVTANQAVSQRATRSQVRHSQQPLARFDWGLLKGKSLGILAEREPGIAYPLEIFEPERRIRIVRFPTMAMMHAAVAEGSLAVLSLPHFLTDAQQASVSVIPIPHLAQLRFAVVRSPTSSLLRSPRELEAVSFLGDRLDEYFRKLVPLSLFVATDQQCSIFFVTRTFEGNRWLRGHIELTQNASGHAHGWLSIIDYVEPDRVSATDPHNFEPNAKYRFRTTIEENASRQRHFFFECSLGDRTTDSFSINFLVPPDADFWNAKGICGTWHGRHAPHFTEASIFTHALGYCLLMSRNEGAKISSELELNRIVLSAQRLSPIELSLPSPK